MIVGCWHGKKCLIRCFLFVFRFYHGSLVPSRKKLESEPGFPLAKIFSPMFRRSIYTVGLLLRHFDFKDVEVYGNNDKGK